METDTQDMSLKFRMTGAFVWLLMLIVVVPIWYSHPVNFSPGMSAEEADNHDPQVVVDKPFVIPGSATEAALPQASSKQEKEVENQQALLTQKKNTSSGTELQKDLVKEAQSVATPPKTVAKEKGEWIIRVAAYRSKEKANLLYEHLKYDYDVFVKFFPKSRYYSVRVGPYTDKALAVRDQHDLNRVLRIHSELAKIK